MTEWLVVAAGCSIWVSIWFGNVPQRKIVEVPTLVVQVIVAIVPLPLIAAVGPTVICGAFDDGVGVSVGVGVGDAVDVGVAVGWPGAAASASASASASIPAHPSSGSSARRS